MNILGLVTVLYNSESVLDGFFRSISIQNYKNYHLYLIDNSPSFASKKLIDDLIIKYGIINFTHVTNGNNIGVAAGNNQGIELSVASGTSHTLLLNNDIEFEESDFFEKLMDITLTNNELITIPKILFYDSRKIWMAGGKFYLNRGVAKHIGEGEDDNPKFNIEKYFNYAPTCFMLFNNKVFESLGLMDEKYFVYYDDTDFLFRCFVNGFKVKYLPQFTVLHKVSTSTGGNNSDFSLYFTVRNRIYFINKHFKGLYYFIPMAFTLISRMVRYFELNVTQKKVLIKAIRDGFTM